MPVVVLGTLALAGYVTVKRALDSTIDTDELEPAIDITAIESAVEEDGLRAITDTETLEAAINDDELDREIDVQRLQSAVEERLDSIEELVYSEERKSVFDAEELDAATDRGLSVITEQEIIEGTIGRDELGVSVDVDELRSVLERESGLFERTADAIAETIIETDVDESMLDAEAEPSDGTRIAVVDDEGRLESLVDESDRDESQFQSIEIEDGDRTEGPDE